MKIKIYDRDTLELLVVDDISDATNWNESSLRVELVVKRKSKSDKALIKIMKHFNIADVTIILEYDNIDDAFKYNVFEKGWVFERIDPENGSLVSYRTKFSKHYLGRNAAKEAKKIKLKSNIKHIM